MTRIRLDTTASDGAAPGCGDDCGLPRIEISDRHRLVQVAGFAILLEEGRAADRSEIAERAMVARGEVDDLLADFDNVGRVRFDDAERVTGIAGLTIVPSRHRIELGGVTRWTWCALDAIGILGALQRDATFTTLVPDSDQEVVLAFSSAGAESTDAVVFIADGYGTDSVVETWCPTVNLFDQPDAAETWARHHGIAGRPIRVTELAAGAAAIWAPIVQS